MTDIARLKDSDGRTHYTARGSEAAERLLRDGAEDLDPPTPTEPKAVPEVADATEPPAQGDDPDAGTTGGGSGQRKRASRTSGSGDSGTGEA